MNVTIEGKVALVTGASRGIGEAIARQFLASGAAGVAVTSRKAENIEAAAERLGGGERVLPLVAKADEDEAAAAAVEAAIERFGSCDILVNNAGTNPAGGVLTDVDLGAIAKTWAVNQLGPLIWSRQVWRQWMSDHGGVIVNTASVGGLQPDRLLGAYNTSKAALIYLTRQLALEFAPTVRVVAVAPAVIKTRLSTALWEGREDEAAALHPLQRLGTTDDVAHAVLFLASGRASWITGVTLPVDGGVSGARGSVAG